MADCGESNVTLARRSPRGAIVAAVTRFGLTRRQVAGGVLALLGWAAFAAVLPGWLGIDHAAGLEIVHAGDPKGIRALYGPHPIAGLVAVALAAALMSLFAAAGVAALRERQPVRRRRVAVQKRGAPASAA